MPTRLLCNSHEKKRIKPSLKCLLIQRLKRKMNDKKAHTHSNKLVHWPSPQIGDENEMLVFKMRKMNAKQIEMILN